MERIDTMAQPTPDETIAALTAPPSAELWTGEHKIPWHEPGFSRRMLREHLTQEHDLASRKAETIAAQAQWIHDRAMDSAPGHILDLGCGPGLYAPHLTEFGHHYLGIDFGPASIQHAQTRHARYGAARFLLADVLNADYGGPHELAMMLYGELNVFSPQACRRILKKAHAALRPGGRILLEPHTFEAVKRSGQGRSWQAAGQGLFSDAPHLCLTRNHWFAEQAVSRQDFHIVEFTGEPGRPSLAAAYHSTMQAWTRNDYLRLLKEAGFVNTAFHEDWPGTPDCLLLVMAMK